jgi:isopropylmalate/homocitrate/citramalate synthase
MFDHFAPLPPATTEPLARLVDVTLRDGGFEVNFDWPADLFTRIPAVLAPLGVETVELGYLGGVPLEHAITAPGIGAHLTPDQVADACQPGVDLAVMIHPTALRTAVDLAAYAAAGLTMVRLVYHPDWFDDIARIATQAKDNGLTVSVNIALASRYGREELVTHATRIDAAMAPDVLYVADTCGALTPEQVTELVTELTTTIGASVGFHAHDFLSLGYANALAAAAAGATYLDCSLLGLGRGGGNLAGELMLIRHRLLGRRIPEALHPLLACRARLAALARRPVPALVPTVCGALNLTPVEEQALVEFAEAAGLDPSWAGLWLVTAANRVTSLRAADLIESWRAQTEPVSR